VAQHRDGHRWPFVERRRGRSSGGAHHGRRRDDGRAPRPAASLDAG
jgi:hypothetical protein